MNFNHPQYSDEKIEKSILEILENNILLSMASVRSGEAGTEAWINTAYYSFDDVLNIYVLTPPSSEHSKNLETNNSVAVSIFDSHQSDPTKLKQGLQIFGTWSRVNVADLPTATLLYAKRFPWLKAFIKSPFDWTKKVLESKLYMIKPSRFKIFDEPTFGEEMWVEVVIE